MATVSEEKEDDLTVCSICLERFKRPKYLPCLHTFCEACLSRYITSALTQGPDNKQGVPCPTCRTFTTVNSEETNPEKLAEEFPVNHLIVSLIDRQNAKDNDKLCDSCTRIDKSNKAEHWCNNCGEALCTQCKTCHLGHKLSVNHNIISLNELSENVCSQLDIFCSQHKDKKIEIYCYEHETPCCSLCLAVYHRSCGEVNTIEEAGKEVRKKTNLETLRKSFSDINQKFQNKIEDRIERRKSLQNSETTMHEDVRNLRQKIIAHLDKLECSLQNKITEMHKKQIDAVTDEQDILQKRKSIADNCMTILDTCQQNASDVQILLELKHLKEKEKELDEFFSSEATKNKDVDVKLEISTDVSDFISNVTTFGKVNEQGVTPDVSATPKFDFHSCTPTLEYTLYNTRISCATYLPNNYIILNHCWDSKVTLIDSNGKCTSWLTLSSSPWDMTLLTPQQAVVTLHSENQLVYINIDPSFLSLSVHKTVTLDGQCTGICRAGQTLLVTYPTQLNVLDLEGRITNTIRVRGSSALYYVTEHKDNIYLSDYVEHFVVCMDKVGTEMFRYTSDKLITPRNITADCEGNIYVAGYGSHNIHQLTDDGKLIRILPVNINQIVCVVFEENSNRFLVSSHGCNTTSLYTMKYAHICVLLRQYNGLLTPYCKVCFDLFPINHLA